MRVVLSVCCSLSLCVLLRLHVALTACRSLCVLLSLHAALAAYCSVCMLLSVLVTLSAFYVRHSLSQRDAFTRPSVVAGRVAQPEPDLVPDLGPVRRLSRARNMPCQSGISHNSSAPLTGRCVPSRSVSFRLVSSRCTSFCFFIHLLFLCELLIYWNTSRNTFVEYIFYTKVNPAEQVQMRIEMA